MKNDIYINGLGMVNKEIKTVKEEYEFCACCDVCACDEQAMRSSLVRIGMDAANIIKYFGLPDNCGEEKIKMLTKCRNNILNEIHDKQKTLDLVDYLIYYNRKRSKQ